MMEDYQSNEWKCATQNGFLKHFEGSEHSSMLETNAVQNFQTEFQPIENDALLVNSSQNTDLQYNLQMEGNFVEPQMYNNRIGNLKFLKISGFEYQNSASKSSYLGG
ncbi:hypothetical protein TNCT_280001 [Trichonephila clavata]|uniref:Uncharacterized protein n=1 Tax=Trichonephila clavata TaxID=2740835 RepID=A0A8X6GN17_TRICU|nr:hypothetical protein TNCT_280001 [Trichonephila clavata]